MPPSPGRGPEAQARVFSRQRKPRAEERQQRPALQQAAAGRPRRLLTQGFIGRSHSGATTTLGREGSDFSAAIFAYLLDAESVTIWKDVPGMFNADPKREFVRERALLGEILQSAW